MKASPKPLLLTQRASNQTRVSGSELLYGSLVWVSPIGILLLHSFIYFLYSPWYIKELGWPRTHYWSTYGRSWIWILEGVQIITESLCLVPKIQSLNDREGNGTPLQYSCLENPMNRRAWKAAVHGVAEGRTRLSDFTFTFHFHALEKERATHSTVLAWRITGTGEPGRLPSMGSHRVRYDWSDLAAVAAVGLKKKKSLY